MIEMYSGKALLRRKNKKSFIEIIQCPLSENYIHKTHQNTSTSVVVAKTHLNFYVNVTTIRYVTTHSCSGEGHQNNTYLLDNIVVCS